MILKQIELENIKTYKKTTIPFKKGLNVFHGGNGTGKSTVLEMIGFILFDFLEIRKHGIYVREVQNDKPQFGTVRLWIIGHNNEPYIIERTIGKSSVAVYNALTNKELKDVTDTVQLKKWIRKQIGVSNNIELDNLFETSIGIPQGTFLLPFQQVARKRKAYFDPILDLEIYEVMWKKLKSLVNKVYSSGLQEVDLQISEIRGAIKDKPDLIEKRKRVGAEVNNLTLQAKESESAYKKLKTEFEKLSEVKTKLESAQQEVEKLLIKRDNEQETVSNLTAQVEEAKKSKKICEAALDKYKRYIKLFGEQTTLQLKVKDLQQTQNELKYIVENYASLKTQEEEVIKNKLKAEDAIKQVKILTPKYNRSIEVENSIKHNDEDMTRIMTIEEGIVNKNKVLGEFRSEIRGMQNEIEIIPELEQKIKDLGELEEIKNKLTQELNKIESKVAILTENQNELKEGTCPILNQQCINVKEGSADFSNVSIQIKEAEEGVEKKRTKIQDVQNKLERKEEIATKLNKLGELKIKVGEIQRQEAVLQEDLSNDQQKIRKKASVVKLREELEKDKQELEGYVEAYRKNKDKGAELPSLIESVYRLEQEVLLLRKNKEQKEEIVKGLAYIPTDIEKIQRELGLTREDHDRYQTNIKQAEQLLKKEGKLKETITILEQFKLRLRETEKVRKNLDTQFDAVKFDQLELETKELEIRIATLQTQVNDNQDRIKEITEDIEKVEQSEQKLVEHNATKDKLEVQIFFIKKMRIWLRVLIPKIRKALISQINVVASEIYRHIREEEGTVVTWKDDYEILVSTSKTKKSFFRLSGGEKMSAALSVRLAILKVLTDANFAFFDEPTTNLDEDSRRNLSKYIHNIKGFEQLFVISHDDSFKRHSEHVIKFSKDENEITHIDYLTKKD